jgi:hypothetical protein
MINLLELLDRVVSAVLATRDVPGPQPHPDDFRC